VNYLKTAAGYTSFIGALAVAGLLLVLSRVSAQEAAGNQLYTQKCAPCHQGGLLGAPKLGDSAAWKPRAAKGRDALLKSVTKGLNNMPPRGGNPSMSDAEVGRALDYMLSQVSGPSSGNAAAASGGLTAGAQAAPAPPQAAAPAKRKPPATAKRRETSVQRGNVNAFNRLMKAPSERNLPPTKDGIHDPTNEGTHILQGPKEAFSSLPKALSGNRVDWVAALKSGKIAPRYELIDSGKEPIVMDLNIVREVKGSMPDVVYPHKQHTQWLDCSNCHPAIFIPKKGANSMSMAGILLGQQCGVCHGKVAFPVSDCRKCHSRKKPATAGQ